MLRSLMVAVVAMSVSLAATMPMLCADAKPDLKLGQMWSINSPTPTTAKVIIGGMEDWHGKVVVHVSIIDVPIPDGAPNAGQMTTIGHAPFEKAALVSSLDRLLSEGRSPPSDFAGGIAQWR